MQGAFFPENILRGPWTTIKEKPCMKIFSGDQLHTFSAEVSQYVFVPPQWGMM
jgi:hypothetical protein